MRVASPIAALVLGFSPVALGQALSVTATPGGTEASGDLVVPFHQATCNGTESTVAGDPAIIQLVWASQGASQVFLDTQSSCNAGVAQPDPDSGLATSTTAGTEIAIPSAIQPCGASGCQAGKVTVDLRTAIATAFASPAFFGDVAFDGGLGGACFPGEAPGSALYLCVVDTSSSGCSFGVEQCSSYWYMTIAYDTLTPSAPSAVTGRSGDQDLTVSWSYADAQLPADHYFVRYRADTTPGLQASPSGVCAVAVPGASGRALPHPPCSPSDAGDCRGDSAVGSCGGCSADSDCAGTDSSCLLDALGNTFCAAACTPDAGTVSLDCPQGFVCQLATSVDRVTGAACVPPDQLCRPSASTCGSCQSRADCAAGDECAQSDGGAFCVASCGVGDGGCLGDTVCETVGLSGARSGLFCAPPDGACYDPEPLSALFADAGQPTVTGDAGSAALDVDTWPDASFPAVVGATSSGQLDGLQNGQCYDVVVQAVLADGTQGAQSAPVVLAPVANADFWRLYQNGGGTDQGGLHCQSAGGPLDLSSIVLLVVALHALRRRRSFRDHHAGPPPRRSGN